MSNQSPLAPEVSDVEILERGREVLEARGLAHRHFHNPDETVCAVGALRVALGFYDKRPIQHLPAEAWMARADRADEVARTLANHLGLGRSVSHVYFWNDSSTIDEVLSGFDKAIWNERERLEP